MKKIYKILLITVILSIALFGFNTVYAYDNFTIETYQVFINVHENNVMDVEEIIYVNFDYASHGIYREIPIKGYSSRTVDDEIIENMYRALISNVDVLNQKFTSKKEGTYQVIKIGDKKVYVDGMQKYHIKYTLDFGDDGIDEFDEFYFNVIGTEWGTYINNVGVIITMPEDIDLENLGLSTGYAGESGTNMVRYSIDENRLILHTTDMLYPYEGLTVRMHLPEGYFTNERIPTDWEKIYYYGIGTLVLLVMLGWLLYGRDEKLYPAVEFYPPEGLTPAEVGYIVDGRVDTKDVLSLLIYWADKGHIKIVETKGKNFYIIKLKPLDDNSEKFEKKLFIGLFKKKTKEDFTDFIEAVSKSDKLAEVHDFLLKKQSNNESLTFVKVSELKNVFYSTIDTVKGQIKTKYTRKKHKGLFTSSSRFLKAIAFLYAAAPIFFAHIVVQSYKTIYLYEAVTGGIFWYGVLVAIFVIFNQTVMRRKSMKRSKKVIAGVVFAVVFALLALITIIIIDDLGDASMISSVAVGASFVILLFALFMEKRTPEASKLQEKILGLRMFLLNAEQHKIETLVDENPDYFFNVLSYAYVLGVTDKWAKQFKDIVMKNPEWYAGTGVHDTFIPTDFNRNLTSNFNTMRSTMASRPASSGSSSGGGGFSSGGGGFSGGGGGGGGGGSW